MFWTFPGALVLLGTAYAGSLVLKVTYYTFRFVMTHFISRIKDHNLHQYGDWAAVTGCTSGIGREYAIELARHGFNLVLLNRPGRVENLAQFIEDRYNVCAIAINADFSQGAVVYDEIAKLIKDIDIGILINNVGVMYDYPMEFTEVRVEKLWELINVNVAAATMMTYLVLPKMLSRRRGAIVNMASASSYMPTPYLAVYSATKSYIDFFSRAIQYEYKGSGIIVQTLVPFYVCTRMTRYAESIAKPSFTIPSAEDFVQNSVRTIGVSGHTTGYWPHSLQLMLCWLIPEWLWLWAASMLNIGLRRQAHRRMMSLHTSSTGSADSPRDSPTHRSNPFQKHTYSLGASISPHMSRNTSSVSEQSTQQTPGVNASNLIASRSNSVFADTI